MSPGEARADRLQCDCCFDQREAPLVSCAVAGLTASKAEPQFCAGPLYGVQVLQKETVVVWRSEERESILAQWRRAIPRTEKRLKENTAMCELHFDVR
ncbi:hypothetical protein HPB48_017686 [Haemaphysalis longicornis]|uniref:THAP-type domain-containing protein n=1 Tax=Haemaphysalis longicornis TaxID=44386 RepID=A0A9J6FZL2_HAELO|nr:hypothetical protein HPB48_017686 [Haemaphysalis longicornis]